MQILACFTNSVSIDSEPSRNQAHECHRYWYAEDFRRLVDGIDACREVHPPPYPDMKTAKE